MKMGFARGSGAAPCVHLFTINTLRTVAIERSPEVEKYMTLEKVKRFPCGN